MCLDLATKVGVLADGEQFHSLTVDMNQSNLTGFEDDEEDVLGEEEEQPSVMVDDAPESASAILKEPIPNNPANNQ